jgi:DHA1 family tetracycline resistance protein-like MFS transporter
LWKYPVVIGLVFAYFFYMLGHHSLPAVWSYFVMEKFAWTTREIGFSLGAVGVCMIFVQVYLIRVFLDKYGQERTAFIGLIVTILSFIGYAFIPYGWMMYVVIAVGAGQGFIGPSVQGLMSARIPADSQGELQGALGSMSSLVSILSPPFMTQTFAYFSGGGAPIYFPGAPFLAAAFFTLMGLLLLVRTLSANRRQAVI